MECFTFTVQFCRSSWKSYVRLQKQSTYMYAQLKRSKGKTVYWHMYCSWSEQAVQAPPITQR